MDSTCKRKGPARGQLMFYTSCGLRGFETDFSEIPQRNRSIQKTEKRGAGEYSAIRLHPGMNKKMGKRSMQSCNDRAGVEAIILRVDLPRKKQVGHH